MTTLVPDELTLLAGADVDELVRAAIGADQALTELVVQIEAVHHRPGLGVSAVYSVGYRTDAGAVHEHLVASTATVPDAADVAVLTNGPHQVRVWRRPDDPALPGLRAALDPAQVGSWLRELQPHPCQEQRARVHMLSYRPTRRAVIRAMCCTRAAPAFLKVLPPGRATRLQRRHRVLEQAGVAAPRVLGEPAPGLVALSAMTGTALTEAIAAARSHPENLPSPAQLIAWLDALPEAVRELPRRSSWVDRIDFHAKAARAAQPAAADRITQLEDGVGVVLAALPAPDLVPTHGDFYEANVFTAAGTVLGAIDLDSLGPGAREDDLATMLGHLSVLPVLAPDRYPHVTELTDAWFAEFAHRVDRASLAARTAAVVLSLVAGTDVEQGRARLTVADRWLAVAQDELMRRHG